MYSFYLKENLKNNNNSPTKESHSIKKLRRRNFSGETIYEEPENIYDNKKDKKNFCYSNFSGKTKKKEEIKNDYFINFTNNICTKESHFEKNYIIRSPRKINNNSKINNYIYSAKTFFNSPKHRMSVINNDFALSNFNKRKFTENTNLNFNKEGLTINSNLKASFIKKKLFNKVDSLLHKDKLTKNESEFVLNYIEEKRRDCESSPRHKININNNNIISPRSKKKKNKNNKNNNFIFKEKNILEEKDKNRTDKTENQQNYNINDTNNIKIKFKWFNSFLCCFKKT